MDNSYSNENVNSDNASKIIVIILLIIVIIMGGIVFYLILNKESNETINTSQNIPGNITETSPSDAVKFDTNKLTINVNESSTLTYQVDDEYINAVTNVTWLSKNNSVADVNDKGTVTGKNAGTTTIVMLYTINGNSFLLECSVEVLKVDDEPEIVVPPPVVVDTTKPSLSYQVIEGSLDGYNKSDVVIQINASDNSGKVSLSYKVNDNNFVNINGNKITISEDGKNTIEIVATDASSNKTSKSLSILIDKTPPTCSVSKSGFSSGVSGNITCNDTGSGCSSSNELSFTNLTSSKTVDIKDNAGNVQKCDIEVIRNEEYLWNNGHGSVAKSKCGGSFNNSKPTTPPKSVGLVKCTTCNGDTCSAYISYSHVTYK